mmetsp:Transcript_52464/g.137370  ORF Transcript_52464/g.137370 Transcript_52464/m.137370 type:complete len:234 (+) Transcript_52464:967-1668(+)
MVLVAPALEVLCVMVLVEKTGEPKMRSACWSAGMKAAAGTGVGGIEKPAKLRSSSTRTKGASCPTAALLLVKLTVTAVPMLTVKRSESESVAASGSQRPVLARQRTEDETLSASQAVKMSGGVLVTLTTPPVCTMPTKPLSTTDSRLPTCGTRFAVGVKVKMSESCAPGYALPLLLRRMLSATRRGPSTCRGADEPPALSTSDFWIATPPPASIVSAGLVCATLGFMTTKRTV